MIQVRKILTGVLWITIPITVVAWIGILRSFPKSASVVTPELLWWDIVYFLVGPVIVFSIQAVFWIKPSSRQEARQRIRDFLIIIKCSLAAFYLLVVLFFSPTILSAREATAYQLPSDSVFLKVKEEESDPKSISSGKTTIHEHFTLENSNYFGQVRNGRRHGLGRNASSEGQVVYVIVGEWEDGRLVRVIKYAYIYIV